MRPELLGYRGRCDEEPQLRTRGIDEAHCFLRSALCVNHGV